VSALVLDAGALIAVDRGDRAMIARLRVAQREGVELRMTGVVVTQVWRQATVARLLKAVDVKAIDERSGRDAGVLLGRAGTEDAVDASSRERGLRTAPQWESGQTVLCSSLWPSSNAGAPQSVDKQRCADRRRTHTAHFTPNASGTSPPSVERL
jgi:hypothetical protein